MKNAYAQKLAAQRTAREMQAHQDGAQFALNLCAVALNNVYGFGRERLERLEQEVNRLLEEEFGHDLELAAEGLARRIEQIRGGEPMSTQAQYETVFATRLRGLLEEKKVTITALAKKLQISRQAVSQYADGASQPNVDKLRLIAQYFEVSADYLLGLSDCRKWGENHG